MREYQQQLVWTDMGEHAACFRDRFINCWIALTAVQWWKEGGMFTFLLIKTHTHTRHMFCTNSPAAAMKQDGWESFLPPENIWFSFDPRRGEKGEKVVFLKPECILAEDREWSHCVMRLHGTYWVWNMVMVAVDPRRNFSRGLCGCLLTLQHYRCQDLFQKICFHNS